MSCEKGHIVTGGTWTHMAMTGLIVVGVLAVSAMRLARSREEDE